MKFIIFTLLFAGIRFVHAQTNLIDDPSTLLSSLVGLLKDATSLLNNPVDGVSGLVSLAPDVINFSSSIENLSRSVDDFSRFIITQPDAVNILTNNFRCCFNYLDDLIVASYHFSQALREQTDEHGNVDILNIYRILKTMSGMTAALNGLSSCIQPKINGDPSGSSAKTLDNVAAKIRETAVAQATFATAVDTIHGITGLVGGVVGFLFNVGTNYEKLSKSLHNFSGAISNLSESSSFSYIISAVNDLAQSEHKISVAFYRLSKL